MPEIAAIVPWALKPGEHTHDLMVDDETLNLVASHILAYSITEEDLLRLPMPQPPGERLLMFAVAVAASAWMPRLTAQMQQDVAEGTLPPEVGQMMRHLAMENPHPGVYMCPVELPPDRPFLQIPEARGWLAWLD